jgi:hypothetical protein
MNLHTLAADLDTLADGSCDDGDARTIRLAAEVVRACSFHGPCLDCTARPAEVNGQCRPCYQRDRRAALRAER